MHLDRYKYICLIRGLRRTLRVDAELTVALAKSIYLPLKKSINNLILYFFSGVITINSSSSYFVCPPKYYPPAAPISQKKKLPQHSNTMRGQAPILTIPF
jgi:hypothetical protein